MIGLTCVVTTNSYPEHTALMTLNHSLIFCFSFSNNLFVRCMCSFTCPDSRMWILQCLIALSLFTPDKKRWNISEAVYVPVVQQEACYTWWKAANDQTKGCNWSSRTSSALQAFVLLFVLFKKSRSKFSQVLNAVLGFRHSDSSGEDHLGKALPTCFCKKRALAEFVSC